MRKRAFEIVPATERDLEAVAEIDRQSLRSRWPDRIYRDELAREWSRLDLYVERGNEGAPVVAGFINFWTVGDEVHLLSLAVAESARRRGVGRRLVEHLIELAHRRRCRCVTLEVRRSNQAAIELYRGFGFKSVGVRNNYYADNGEDAVVMMLETRV